MMLLPVIKMEKLINCPFSKADVLNAYLTTRPCPMNVW